MTLCVRDLVQFIINWSMAIIYYSLPTIIFYIIHTILTSWGKRVYHQAMETNCSGGHQKQVITDHFFLNLLFPLDSFDSFVES